MSDFRSQAIARLTELKRRARRQRIKNDLARRFDASMDFIRELASFRPYVERKLRERL